MTVYPASLSLSLSLSLAVALFLFQKYDGDRRRNVWIGHYDIDVPVCERDPSGVSCLQPSVCAFI